MDHLHLLLVDTATELGPGHSPDGDGHEGGHLPQEVHGVEAGGEGGQEVTGGAGPEAEAQEDAVGDPQDFGGQGNNNEEADHEGDHDQCQQVGVVGTTGIKLVLEEHIDYR